jgi:hypothetical protein
MAPCFGCTQDRSACIVYDGPDQRPARAPDSYGSNGGNQPPPGSGDSDICRKSPQSYSCLFGHRDVVPPPVPQPGDTDCETARAPCGSKALAAEGWRIKRRIAGSECLWTKAAAEEAYDPTTINAAWKSGWYPKWKAAVQKIFDRRLPLMRNLTASGVTVDWWFSVEVNPDGSIRAVTDQQSSYQPKHGPGYGDSRFKEETEQWMKMLREMRAPAFPAGSALTGATMSVNFNNHSDRVRDPPTIPQEPPLGNEQKLRGKKC